LNSDLDVKIERQAGKATKLLTAGPDQRATLHCHYDSKTYWDVKDNDDNHNLRATTALDPFDVAFAVVWMQSCDPSLEVQSPIFYEILIKYHVEFTSPKELGGS